MIRRFNCFYTGPDLFCLRLPKIRKPWDIMKFILDYVMQQDKPLNVIRPYYKTFIIIERRMYLKTVYIWPRNGKCWKSRSKTRVTMDSAHYGIHNMKFKRLIINSFPTTYLYTNCIWPRNGKCWRSRSKTRVTMDSAQYSTYICEVWKIYHQEVSHNGPKP